MYVTCIALIVDSTSAHNMMQYLLFGPIPLVEDCGNYLHIEPWTTKGR